MNEIVSGMKEQFKRKLKDGIGTIVSNMEKAINPQEDTKKANTNIESAKQIFKNIDKYLTAVELKVNAQGSTTQGTYKQ